MALTTQQMLDAANIAYHQLQTGTLARVFVDQNGERVEFTAASKAALLSYIQQLQNQVALGVSDIPAPRAIGVFF